MVRALDLGHGGIGLKYFVITFFGVLTGVVVYVLGDHEYEQEVEIRFLSDEIVTKPYRKDEMLAMMSTYPLPDLDAKRTPVKIEPDDPNFFRDELGQKYYLLRSVPYGDGRFDQVSNDRIPFLDERGHYLKTLEWTDDSYGILKYRAPGMIVMGKSFKLEAEFTHKKPKSMFVSDLMWAQWIPREQHFCCLDESLLGEIVASNLIVTSADEKKEEPRITAFIDTSFENILKRRSRSQLTYFWQWEMMRTKELEAENSFWIDIAIDQKSSWQSYIITKKLIRFDIYENQSHAVVNVLAQKWMLLLWIGVLPLGICLARPSRV